MISRKGLFEFRIGFEICVDDLIKQISGKYKNNIEKESH